MKREYKLFIQDIKDCIAQIDEFVGNMALEEFKADEKTSSAVVRKIEMSETLMRNLLTSVRSKHSAFLSMLKNCTLWTSVRSS